jgi:hypothetical protein
MRWTHDRETAREIPSRYAAFLHAKLSAASPRSTAIIEAPGHIAPFMVDERKEGLHARARARRVTDPRRDADESARVLEQARALEDADGYWEPAAPGRDPGCHKSSLYRDTPLMNSERGDAGRPALAAVARAWLLALRSKSLTSTTSSSRTTRKVG